MPEKISIMNPREKQVYTWFLVVRAGFVLPGDLYFPF